MGWCMGWCRCTPSTAVWFLVLLAAAKSQDPPPSCTTSASCETCNSRKDISCGWCASDASGAGTCQHEKGACPDNFWNKACCAPYSTCDACAKAGSCVWCEHGSSINGGKCIPTTGTGAPALGGCDSNFFTNWCCRDNKDCRSCLDSGMRCAWCAGGTTNPEQCLPATGTGAPMYEGCDAEPFSDKNYWDTHCCYQDYHNCADCLRSHDRCGWCSGGDVNAGRCLVAGGNGGPKDGGCTEWGRHKSDECGPPVPCGKNCEDCDAMVWNEQQQRFVGVCRRCLPGYYGQDCDSPCPSTCSRNDEAGCARDSGASVCYATLDGVALDEGKNLATVTATGVDQCTTLCSATAGCNSVTFCPDGQPGFSHPNQCYFKDKVLDKSTPVHDVGRNCKSHYTVPCPAAGSFDADAAAGDYINFARLAYASSPTSCLSHMPPARYSDVHLETKQMVPSFPSDRIAVVGGVINERNEVVLAFRGTEDPKQAWHEVLQSLTTPKGVLSLQPAGDAYVQVYFLNGFKLLLPWCEEYLTNHWKPGMGIVFVGHSLGGAFASIMSLHYSPANADNVASLPWAEAPISLYTYGQPRVGDFRYSGKHDRYVPNAWRVTHENDLVPHIPSCFHVDFQCSGDGAFTAPYHHGKEIWFNNPMASATDYRDCCGPPLDEDAKCSNSYPTWKLAKPSEINLKHKCYYGKGVGVFCTDPAAAREYCVGDSQCQGDVCHSGMVVAGIASAVLRALLAVAGDKFKEVLRDVIGSWLGVQPSLVDFAFPESVCLPEAGLDAVASPSRYSCTCTCMANTTFVAPVNGCGACTPDVCYACCGDAVRTAACTDNGPQGPIANLTITPANASAAAALDAALRHLMADLDASANLSSVVAAAVAADPALAEAAGPEGLSSLVLDFQNPAGTPSDPLPPCQPPVPPSTSSTTSDATTGTGGSTTEDTSTSSGSGSTTDDTSTGSGSGSGSGSDEIDVDGNGGSSGGGGGGTWVAVVLVLVLAGAGVAAAAVVVTRRRNARSQIPKELQEPFFGRSGVQ